ncbi:discoidin domain-containing protein [Paenibacillus terreus]|uniref:Discoidin domain-containing protein n=1 Tax=Paenibacillus terreus TaxID=1387834 RepID=A0ABV5B5C4_9BACL
MTKAGIRKFFPIFLITLLLTTSIGNNIITQSASAAASNATITLTADNEYTLYHNGTLVGSGNQWTQANTFKLDLQQGKNVIAVKATNLEMQAGLLADLVYQEESIVSDFNWKTTATHTAGWEQTNFDDTSWQHATDFGMYGMSPWNKSVTGMPDNTSARWIWIGDTYNNPSVKEAYFRMEFTVSDDGLDISNPITNVGEFANVQYKLKSNIPMPSLIRQKIGITGDMFTEIPATGSFSITAAEYAQLSSTLVTNQIYLDEATDQSIKITKVAAILTSSGYVVEYAIPQFEELFEYYSIPEQTVTFDQSNLVYPSGGSIVSFSDVLSSVYNDVPSAVYSDVPTSVYTDMVTFGADDFISCSKSGSDFVCNFKKELINQKSGGKETLVEAGGTLTLKAPKLKGTYKHNKFDLKFTAGESANVYVKGKAQFEKEIKVPLYGLELDAGKVGKATVGIFLVIGIDGNVSFEFVVDQGYSLEAGVKGKNFLYIPRLGTIKPYSSVDRHLNVTHQIEGTLTARAGAQAEVGLEVLGISLVGVKVFAGIEGKGAWTSSLNVPYTMTLTIDALVEGDATAIGKNFDLFEFRWNLVNLRKEPSSGSSTNLALGATITADSTYPGYSVTRINDGDRNTTVGEAYSWANDNRTPLPQYVTVEMLKAASINRIDLYTSSGYPLADYDLEYWNGSAWASLVKITGNTETYRTHSFAGVQTSKVRVVARKGPSHQLGYVRINELEIYGAVNVARSASITADTTFPGYSVARINDGDRNTTVGEAYSWANNYGSPLPQHVVVSFSQPAAISRIELYTSTGYPMADYDFQYWNGSSWVNLAAVTGNTNEYRSHSFPTVQTSQIRVVARKGPSHQLGYVRINELEIY